MSPFYVRRKRRRVVSIPRALRKYDVLHRQFQGTIPVVTDQQNPHPAGYFGLIYSTIVGNVNSAGVRKAKNFTLQISPSQSTYNGNIIPMTYKYMLVYIPQGINAAQGFIPNANPQRPAHFFEMDQNVILCGLGISTRPLTRYTSLSRNLNSGDSIYLYIQGMSIINADDEYYYQFDISCTYALCYN